MPKLNRAPACPIPLRCAKTPQLPKLYCLHYSVQNCGQSNIDAAPRKAQAMIGPTTICTFEKRISVQGLGLGARKLHLQNPTVEAFDW